MKRLVMLAVSITTLIVIGAGLPGPVFAQTAAPGAQTTDAVPAPPAWLVGEYTGTQAGGEQTVGLIIKREPDGSLSWERTLQGMSGGKRLRDNARAVGKVAVTTMGPLVVFKLEGAYSGSTYRGSVTYTLAAEGEGHLKGAVIGGSGQPTPVELRKKK